MSEDTEHNRVERRSGPWDRRIPNMPGAMGLLLRFLYKTKTLCIITCR